MKFKFKILVWYKETASLRFQQKMISFVLYELIFLHFRKLIAHSAAVNIKIICQLLAFVWNKKRTASGTFRTIGKIGHQSSSYCLGAGVLDLLG